MDGYALAFPHISQDCMIKWIIVVVDTFSVYRSANLKGLFSKERVH